MGCRRWLGFEGGVGVVGQGGSEGIVQVWKDHGAGGVKGNVNVGSLPTISVGQVQRGLVEKVHAPKGANMSA